MKDQYASSEYKVTYYLGAGASAEALPIVNAINKGKENEVRGLPDALKQLSNEIEALQNIGSDNQEYVSELVNSLKNLSEEALRFGTIDTYAKFLHLKDRAALKVLRETLAFYFMAEQIIKKSFDKRSLIFLTTVLNYKNIFPTNIKIITWNYDFQIELAGENFVNEHLTKGRGVFKHATPLINYYPGLGNFRRKESNEYSLVHLNGIAGSFIDTDNLSNHLFNNNLIDNYNELITEFKKGKNLDKTLEFAFETQPSVSNSILHAKEIIKETEVLVIIGYSFPFFNREVDKEIFEKLKESKKLKKIYFQDPYNTGEFLKNQFNLDDTIIIKHIADVRNYFVPQEL